MSSEFAAPDYEPTANEIDSFLSDTFGGDLVPGAHGSVTIIPGFERYIWQLPVYWGHRHVNENGSISLEWCVPGPYPHDE